MTATTTTAAPATADGLAAELVAFATGAGDADSIPGQVRQFAGLDPDAAAAAMNRAANELGDSHEAETGDTIADDDRANLFYAVAWYMLGQPGAAVWTLTGTRADTAIVDAAILASWKARAGETPAERIARVRGWSE